MPKSIAKQSLLNALCAMQMYGICTKWLPRTFAKPHTTCQFKSTTLGQDRPIAQRLQPVQQIIRRLQLHGGRAAGYRDRMQRFEMRLHLIGHFHKFQTTRPMHLGRFLLRTECPPRLKQVHQHMKLRSGQRCSVFHAFSVPFCTIYQQVERPRFSYENHGETRACSTHICAVQHFCVSLEFWRLP